MTKKCSIVGIVIGMISLTTAFLSPWIVDLVSPPPPPIEEEAVNFALKLKDVAIAKAKGEEYVSNDAPKQKHAGQFVAPGVIAFSMIGVCFGVIGLVTEEKRLPGSIAVGLGISAAIVQWSIIMAGIVLFLIIVGLALNSMGIDLDFG